MTTEFNPHGFNHSFPRVYEAEQGKYVEYEDYAILKAEVERLTAFTTRTIIPNEELQAQVERLTKAVMHSPAAQLKLKELEGKTTFEEINPKEAENAALMDEVERLKEDNRQLTKAFEIAEGIIKRMGKAAEDAAKEGKHP
jgi:hypothetical protein